MTIDFSAEGKSVPVIDGDYLDLIGPDDPDEVLQVVSAVLGVPLEAWQRQGMFPLLGVGESVEIVVDYAPLGPNTACVAIADLDGNTQQRRHLTAVLSHALTAKTGWQVRYSSDDPISMTT
jgi:hypothetical protein